jgi:hypothetical protein
MSGEATAIRGGRATRAAGLGVIGASVPDGTPNDSAPIREDRGAAIGYEPISSCAGCCRACRRLSRQQLARAREQIERGLQLLVDLGEDLVTLRRAERQVRQLHAHLVQHERAIRRPDRIGHRDLAIAHRRPQILPVAVRHLEVLAERIRRPLGVLVLVQVARRELPERALLDHVRLRPRQVVEILHEHVGIDAAAAVHRATGRRLELRQRREHGVARHVHLERVLGVVAAILELRVVALDHAAARRVVVRDREQQLRAVVEPQLVLDQALAERVRAGDETAVEVLHRARDDLGRRRAAVVDEHHDRAVDVLVATRAAVVRIRRVDATARVDEQLVARHELIEHIDGLRQQASGVRAQVDEQRLHALRLQRRQRLVELFARRLREADDTHVADARLDHVGVRNALDRDLRPLDREVQGLGHVVAVDRDLDGAPRRPAQQLEHVVVRQVLGERLLVDLGDAITRGDAQPERGRALERRDHDDRAVSDLELDADAGVLAAEVFVHSLRALLGQIHGVRIERLQHAVDRAVDQLLVVRHLDVVVLHEVQHLREQVELAAEIVRRLQSAGETEPEEEREGHRDGEGT